MISHSCYFPVTFIVFSWCGSFSTQLVFHPDKFIRYSYAISKLSYALLCSQSFNVYSSFMWIEHPYWTSLLNRANFSCYSSFIHVIHTSSLVLSYVDMFQHVLVTASANLSICANLYQPGFSVRFSYVILKSVLCSWSFNVQNSYTAQWTPLMDVSMFHSWLAFL